MNNGYLGKSDVTSQNYCSAYIIKGKCNFTANGIETTGYYGNMIQNVYWNTGDIIGSYKVGYIYNKEIAIRTVQAKLGLLNASDFIYSSNLREYPLNSQPNYNGNAWLYGKGDEYIINRISGKYNNTYFVSRKFILEEAWCQQPLVVRPGLCLKDSVYVVSGDGTEANPYQIAM